ncbi:MAG: cytochrome o ubiquinol oxidase subunit [Acetobacteraceae bacterium]|jgi:cytochrome o ubiquinol oxidase operon protein cyoD|nr:cytochrome o ubiquinol oxidase subunit [Acetobacteraceae bacterium]
MSSVKQQSKADSYRHDLRGYQTGFALAVILTIVPFALVATGTFSTIAVLWVIGVLGLVQIGVHVRYFLHVDLSPEKREEFSLMAFSGSMLVLMIAGMLWILFNMNMRMMPM